MSDIIKPIIDTRDYTYGVFNNNIKYVIVYDKLLINTSMSVSVGCGYFNDYKYFYGIAHFIEHLLFMGSVKYPIQNYFDNKLNEFNGSSNASTSENNTTYILDILNKGFVEILDIFSRFFIDPLFSAEAIKKEMNAVNSEHLKNINSNISKLLYVCNLIANKDSPLNTFGCGSLETLDIKNARKLILDFYEKNYTTDNISICVISSHPSTDVFNNLLNTFGQIKKSTKQQFIINQPFYNNNKNNIYFLKNEKYINNILYIWEIPKKYYKDFIVFVSYLNNKSDNSLYYYLFKLGYIIMLDSYIEYIGTITLMIELTDLGYNNLKTINDIIFSYINNIKNNDLVKYNLYIKKKRNILFNYFTRESNTSYAHYISENNLIIDSKYILNKLNFYIQEDSNDYLHEIILKHINIDNKIIILNSNQLTKYDIIEEIDMPFYNCKFYNLKTLDFKSYNNISWKQLDLINKYLDKSIKLYKVNNHIYTPILVYDNIWYTYFNKQINPIVTIWLSISNDKYYKSSKNYILTSIFVNILEYIINIKLFKILECFAYISITTNLKNKSIDITIYTLNNKYIIKKLINSILKYISNILKYMENIIDDIFINNEINDHSNTIKSIITSNPRKYNDFLLDCDTYTFLKIKNMTDAINNITKKNIYLYSSNILNKSNMKMFIIGSIKNKNILNIIDKKYMQYFDIYNTNINKISAAKSINIYHPNINENNNIVLIYYPIPSSKSSTLQSLIITLFINIFSRVFFDELRTKQQLGYIVTMRSKFLDKYYIIQEVQSLYNPDIIIEKINIFNNNILKYLKNIDISIYINNFIKDLIYIKPIYSNIKEFYLNKISSNNFNFYSYIYYKQEYKNINIKLLKKFIINYITKDNQIIRIIKYTKKI